MNPTYPFYEPPKQPSFVVTPDDSCSILIVTAVFLLLGRKMVANNDKARARSPRWLC